MEIYAKEQFAGTYIKQTVNNTACPYMFVVKDNRFWCIVGNFSIIFSYCNYHRKRMENFHLVKFYDNYMYAALLVLWDGLFCTMVP